MPTEVEAKFRADGPGTARGAGGRGEPRARRRSGRRARWTRPTATSTPTTGGWPRRCGPAASDRARERRASPSRARNAGTRGSSRGTTDDRRSKGPRPTRSRRHPGRAARPATCSSPWPPAARCAERLRVQQRRTERAVTLDGGATDRHDHARPRAARRRRHRPGRAVRRGARARPGIGARRGGASRTGRRAGSGSGARRRATHEAGARPASPPRPMTQPPLPRPRDARGVAGHRRRAGRVRLPGLGPRAVGPAPPAAAAPRSRSPPSWGWWRSCCVGDELPRTRIDTAVARAARRVRAGHRVRPQRRDEPARDGGHHRVRGHAAGRPSRRAPPPGVGRPRHQRPGAPPLDPDAGDAALPPTRVGARWRPGPPPTAHGGRGHAVRIGGGPTVRDHPRLGAGGAHRACLAPPGRARRPRRRRDPDDDPVGVAVGLAGDRGRGSDRRRAVRLAPSPTAAPVVPRDLASGPRGHRRAGGRGPGRGARPATRRRDHLAPVPVRALARHAGRLADRSAPRHRAGVHAVRTTGGRGGLHLPGAPAALAQPAARRAGRRRRARPPRRGGPRGHAPHRGRPVAQPDNGRTDGGHRSHRPGHRRTVRRPHLHPGLRPPRDMRSWRLPCSTPVRSSGSGHRSAHPSGLCRSRSPARGPAPSSWPRWSPPMPRASPIARACAARSTATGASRHGG